MFIFLGIIFYLLIAFATFRIFAANDIFKEFEYPEMYNFPIATFFSALFWIIIIPLMIFAMLFSWLGEEISSWGYVIRQLHKQKQKTKERK